MKKTFFASCLIIISCFQTISQNNEITLEDIFLKGTFRTYGPGSIKALSDGIHYIDNEYMDNGHCNIIKREISDGAAVDTLFKSTWIPLDDLEAAKGIYGFELSKDEQFVLFTGAPEHIYRHSTREANYIWDRKNKKLSYVAEKHKKVRYAQFSPDNKLISYVSNNDLYIYDIANNKTKQITNDGKFNEVINGATDWVYEEEFAFDIAYFWSPNSKNIAYYRFDESRVKEFSFPEYNGLYPSSYTFKYPKAGEANSLVSIYTYDITSGQKNKVEVIENNEDAYIPRVKWTNNPNLLSVIKLNRLQNKLEMYHYDLKSKDLNLVRTEESDTYIDINEGRGDYHYYLEDNSFVFLSDKSGYTHIYHHINGKEEALTKGNFDVMSIDATDNAGNIFFTAAKLNATQTELYFTNIKSGKTKKLSDKTGQNSVHFLQGNKYYINTYSNANSPNTYSLYNSKGKLIRVLEENKDLKETFKNYTLAQKKFVKVPLSKDLELNAWIMVPADFDSTKKYPVFFSIYGGPGSRTVTDSWDRNYMWNQLLTQKGYIVVSVDNRGTGLRGREFKKCTYGQLGKLETEDQIEAAKYFGSLNYVDKDRIGVFGWSYGGYMSSLCLLKGAEYFKAAIAVAPVTNWRYYDTIYTERYMGLPQDNAKGYDENSPINHVEKLRGNYLLIHGTADDNVHFQNTVEMNKALIEAGKQYELFFYPNKNHSIGGSKTRYHLYSQMTDFILKNL